MARIIVYHSYYGCDTGCCGHTVELQDDDGRFIDSKFDFGHPFYKKEAVDYAKELVMHEFGPDHVKDLDWDNCEFWDYETRDH